MLGWVNQYINWYKINHFRSKQTQRNVAENGSSVVVETHSLFVIRRHIGNVVSTAVVQLAVVRERK